MLLAILSQSHDWLRFDNFEVHPCVLLSKSGEPVKDYDDSADSDFEQVEEGAEGIVCWSVYGHLPLQGLESLFDFSTKDEAMAMQTSMMARLKQLKGE